MSDAFAGETGAAAPRFDQVQLDLLAPDPDQVRKHFDADALSSLSDSLRQNGLIQPIVVRPGAGGKLQIVAGERRYRAAGMAGLTQVPVIVREDLVGKDLTVIQVLENLQREDLTLAETCAGVARLVEAVGFAEAVKQLGKSEAWVSKHASVVGLPDAIKKLVGEGKIDSVDIAKELASLLELDPDEATRLIQRLDPDYGLSEKEIQKSRDEEHKAREGRRQDFEQIDDPEIREYEELEVSRWDEPRPLTRSEVRLAVLEAKQDRQTHTPSTPDTDASEAKRQAAEKKKQAAERQRQTQIQQLSKDCELLGHQLTKKLHVVAGIKEPTRGQYNWNEDLAVEIRADHFSSYSSTVPASTGAAKFHCESEGSPEHVETFTRLLQESEPKLDMRLEDQARITLAEAKAIAKILGKRVGFSFACMRTGAALQKLIDAAASPSKAKPKASLAEEADPISRFLVERTRKATPAHKVKASELHAAYVTWCKVNKVMKPSPINSNRWGESIAAAGIEKTRSGGIQYIGIKLVEAGK